MSVIQRLSRFKAIAVGLLALAAVYCIHWLDLPFSRGWLLIAMLLVLGVAVLVLWALAPIARKRGWGNEYRLTRKHNRPRFEDESRRAGP